MRLRCLIAALAALALAGCGGGERARPGDSVRVFTAIDGKSAFVMLPTGRLDVVVAPSVAKLPEGVRDAHDVEDGGTWVGVRWRMNPFSHNGAAALALQRPPLKPARVVLVADGRRYPLGPAYGLAGSRAISSLTGSDQYVAVAGQPKHVSLAVTYDGVTQTVEPATGRRDAGRAAGLYDPVESHPACAGPATTRPALENVRFRCRVNAVVMLPYVGGLGWAEPGRRWAVVEVYTGLRDAYPEWQRPNRPDAVRYTASPVGARRSYSVDDAVPAATIRSTDGPNDELGDALRLLAFDVPADAPGTLRVEHSLFLRPVDLDPGDVESGAPEVAVLTVRMRAPLG